MSGFHKPLTFLIFMHMKYYPLLLSMMLVFSCTSIETDVIKEEDTADSSLSIYEKGEIKLRFNEEMTLQMESALENGTVMTKSSELNSVFADLGITSARRLFAHGGEYEQRMRQAGLHRWYVVEFDSETPVTKAENDLCSIPGVEIAEPAKKIRSMQFNDLDDKLWGLYNRENPGADINVSQVWENYTTGDPKVIVSVVDGGIDLKHEDLASNCAAGGHFNFVDDNAVITAESHGTHVAGTIAGVNNNGKGIAGVAGGDYAAGKSGVTLLSCQIFKQMSDGKNKGGDSASAIVWGANHGAVISQNSWGYDFDANGDGKVIGSELEKALAAEIDASLKEAVDYFIRFAGCDNQGNQRPDSPMKGGVVIFAAGNDGIANGAPANYEPIIAVGSMGPGGKKTSFSCYGPWVDICAPGESIMSTVPSNKYESMNGTSMACPHVSGVAALVVSYHGGQGFTNEMLVEKLIGGSNESIISPSDQIGGLVDALGAITYGSDAEPEPVKDLVISPRSNYLDLQWTAAKDSDNKPVYGYYIFYSADRAAVENATVEKPGESKMKIFNPSAAVGETVKYTLEELDFSRKYYVKVVSYGYNMKKAEASDIVSAETQANLPPVIMVDGGDNPVLKSDSVVEMYISFSEPDGHKFEIAHVAGSTAESFADNLDGRWRLTITASNAEPGSYSALIKATDQYGCVGSKTINYQILPNRPPVVLKSIDDMVFKNKGSEFTLNLKEYFSDEDGEVLKYECTVSNEKVFHLNANGSTLYGTVLGYGAVEAVVTAKDAKGEKASISFKVIIRASDKPVDLYPVPVKDYLYVATEKEGNSKVVIRSSSGKLLIEQNINASLFTPAQVDMNAFAPGIYSVVVTIGSEEYKNNIVKL